MRGEAAKRARGACRGNGSSPSPCSSASPPPARPVPLNAAVSARIARRRASGSLTFTGNVMKTKAMRLPIAASSPAPRRDTGTITFSGAGTTCRSSDELAQRAGDHRERDVVERGVARALDLEQVARPGASGRRACGAGRSGR